MTTRKQNLIAQNLGPRPLYQQAPTSYIGPWLNGRIMVPLGAGAELNIVDFSSRVGGSATHINIYIYIYIYIAIHTSGFVCSSIYLM